MPRKNVLASYKAIVNGNMAGNLTSAITNISFLDNIVIQLNATGSPSGTYTIETSADYAQDSQGNVINAGNWNQLTLNPTADITGAGITTIELNQIPGPYIRVKYTAASGSGTLNMYIAAKEI